MKSLRPTAPLPEGCANRWLTTVHRFRYLIAYIAACYGFWIVGLPLWFKTITQLGGLESTLFFGVVVASPISVPGALLFSTFVALPRYGASGSTILVVWGIFVTSLVLSLAITRFTLGWLTKRLTKNKSIQQDPSPNGGPATPSSNSGPAEGHQR
jgi:hypothetical protein